MGKTKAEVTIKLLRQFSRSPHSVTAKDNNKQSPENSEFFQAEFSAGQKTFSCEKSRTEKASKQVF